MATLFDPDQAACDQVAAENVTEDEESDEGQEGEEGEEEGPESELEVDEEWSPDSIAEQIAALGFSTGSAVLVLQNFGVVLPNHHATAEAGFDALYDRLCEGGETAFADAASDRLARASQQTEALRGNAVETLAMLLEVERDALLRGVPSPPALGSGCDPETKARLLLSKLRMAPT
jgi:hypothetical protein